jgi:hypothetical protein
MRKVSEKFAGFSKKTGSFMFEVSATGLLTFDLPVRIDVILIPDLEDLIRELQNVVETAKKVNLKGQV